MDLLNILNQISSKNLDINSLINLVSTIFGNNSKQTPQQEQAPPTNFDMNNPYWSLPTYNNNPPKDTYTNQNTNYIQNSPNSMNNNILELLKIALPLLTKQKEKSQNNIETQNFDSEILKLKKTK